MNKKNKQKIISKSFTDLNFDFDEFDILNPILNSLSENEILILIQLKEWEQKFKDDYINMLDYANERVQINKNYSWSSAPKYGSFW